jgi:hypothetical protein
MLLAYMVAEEVAQVLVVVVPPEPPENQITSAPGDRSYQQHAFGSWIECPHRLALSVIPAACGAKGTITLLNGLIEASLSDSNLCGIINRPFNTGMTSTVDQTHFVLHDKLPERGGGFLFPSTHRLSLGRFGVNKCLIIVGILEWPLGQRAISMRHSHGVEPISPPPEEVPHYQDIIIV